MGLNPFIPLLTRPEVHGSNRPKPNSIGPTRAPVLLLSFYFLHPHNTVNTPPLACISILFIFYAFYFHHILFHNISHFYLFYAF